MNAYRSGKDAAFHGGKEEDNPFTEGTWEYEDWLNGFYYEEVMEKTHKGKEEWQ